MGNIVFNRIWEMPNSNTFDIKCIRKLIHKYMRSEMESIDPFANKCKLAKITNKMQKKNTGKTYCLGDIHGAHKALVQCLERSNFNKEEDTLIFLGDVCDGWDEVYECVEELISIKNLIAILGNHDKIFIDWINTGNHSWDWLQGAEATAKSYAKYVLDREVQIRPSMGGYAVNLSYADIPDSHLKFYRYMNNYYIDDKERIFVHGGFNRHEPIKGQPSHHFYWDRDLFMSALSYKSSQRGEKEKKYPFKLPEGIKEVFVGHTATVNWDTDKPIQAGPIWNLDTGAGFNGKLTIMDVDSKEYWQSDLVKELYPNQKGR